MENSTRTSTSTACLVFIAAGLVSGLISGFIATRNVLDLPQWLPPFLPGLAYGGLTGICLFAFRATTAGRALAFALAMIVTWAIGLNLAPLTCANWLTGGGIGCTLYAAGLLGGFAGTLGVIAIAAILFPAVRRPGLLGLLLGLGTVSGALLELGPYWVFCGWQALINGVLGYGLFCDRKT